MSDLKIHPCTCACHRGKHPTLAITDGAAFTPLSQDFSTAGPVPWKDPVRVLVPLSHKHAAVVVAVDLWVQSVEDVETGGRDVKNIKCNTFTGTRPSLVSVNVASGYFFL